MAKVLLKQIYTAFIAFINISLRFSTHRVENLMCIYRGHITEPYYKYTMKLHVNGMKRKHMSRLGVCALYREI